MQRSEKQVRAKTAFKETEEDLSELEFALIYRDYCAAHRVAIMVPGEVSQEKLQDPDCYLSLGVTDNYAVLVRPLPWAARSVEVGKLKDVDLKICVKTRDPDSLGQFIENSQLKPTDKVSILSFDGRDIFVRAHGEKEPIATFNLPHHKYMM